MRYAKVLILLGTVFVLGMITGVILLAIFV